MINKNKKEMREDMEIKEIIDELKYYEGILPRKALENAIVQKEKIISELLKMLEYTKDNLKNIYDEKDEFYGYIYAIFLLAQFREKKAFSFLIDLLKQPTEIVEYILGEDYPDYLPRLLASTYNGDDESLFKIIEDNNIDEFIRSSVLQSFAILYLRGQKTREFVVNYFIKLLNEKQEEDTSYLYAEIFTETYDLRLIELKGLIDKTFGLMENREEVDDLIKRFNDENYKINLNVYPFIEHYNYINDIVEIMEEWECFSYDEDEEFESSEQFIISEHMIKERRNGFSDKEKVGRNDLCFCGSGKKYKKCCMNKNIEDKLDTLEFIDRCIARAEWYDENEMIKKELKELRRAWFFVSDICRNENIKTIKEYDEKYEGYNILSNWIQYYDNLLDESNQENYLVDRINLCKDAKEIFDLDGYWDEHFTRSLANSYYRLGERKKAEQLMIEYLQKDSEWGFGYVEMADWYLSFAEKDYEKARDILEKALQNENLRDKDVLYERLIDIFDKLGNKEKSKYYDEKWNEFIKSENTTCDPILKDLMKQSLEMFIEEQIDGNK